jgi:predicted enzyme involved in methoxymalonyl-ACP biosynthesis
MSCRVIGRSVEDYFLSFILDNCRKAGKKKLVGLYSPTEKNSPVKDFYPRLNFRHRSENNGVFIYEFNIESESFSPPEWIKKKV